MLRERYTVFRQGPWRYAVAIAFTALAFGLRFSIDPIIQNRSPFVASVLAVALSAIAVGARPGLVSMVGGLAVGLFFCDTKYRLIPTHIEDVVQALLYVVSSVVIIAAAEVTERERIERRSASDRFRLLTEQAHEYAVITTDPNGIIQSWSKGAEQLFGLREDEARGRHGSIIFTEADRKRGIPEAEIHTAENEGQAVNERWLVRRDGSQFFGLGVLVALRDGEGKILELAKIVRDGTHLKRREEQLTQRAEQSESALVKTTQQVDAFTYTVAHDLRAPLRALDGYAKALRDDCGPEIRKQGHEYIARILAATHRMDELVTDLLEFWRLTRLREPLKTVDANAVLNRVLSDFSHDIAATNAHIEREELPLVRAHDECLYKALYHLISNALKFSHPSQPPRIEIGSEQRDGFVHLYVRDNGPGIASEYHDRIFRVFERLSKEKAGTGIGLSIVHQCAQSMGGRAGVNSEPGKGSCFWLELQGVESTKTLRGSCYDNSIGR